MAEHIDPKAPIDTPDPGTVPAQPEAAAPMKKGLPVIIGLGAIILIIGLANLGNFTSSAKRMPANSQLLTRPAAPNATQVSSFEQQQQLQAQKDAAERARQEALAAQMAQLQQEQVVPGPESPNAPAMTPAQRAAMYGDNNPNAPKKTSNVSQAQAEAKERALSREQEHQRALASDTVAIDFSNASGKVAQAVVAGESTEASNTAHGEVPPAQAEEATSGPGEAPVISRPSSGIPTRPGTVQRVSADPTSAGPKDPMAEYVFDSYQGRLFRVFEGTVFEGVVTNHIDGALAGPMIVMLTTDYYSHDHQQLLLPQGTRLIGQVTNVSGTGQRKLMVTFNRAICPDGFSLDLNKYQGLDPLGTTGLATNVNNHYFSSFAAAAAIGGLGGLAQINNGSILDASSELRSGITAETSQEGEQILQRLLSRLPVITVKEGSRARIYINHDILIPSYAEHRVDPIL